MALFILSLVMLAGMWFVAAVRKVPEGEILISMVAGRPHTIHRPGWIVLPIFAWELDREKFAKRNFRIKTGDHTTNEKGLESRTKHNLAIVKADLEVIWHVVAPMHMTKSIQVDYRLSVEAILFTTVRSAMGDRTADDILTNPKEVAADALEKADSVLERWGLEVKQLNLANLEIVPEGESKLITEEAK